MKATIRDRLFYRVNDGFSEALRAALAEKYPDLKVCVAWNCLAGAHGALVTTREDEKPFTKDQHAYIAAFSDGYSKAQQLVAEPLTGVRNG